MCDAGVQLCTLLALHAIIIMNIHKNKCILMDGVCVWYINFKLNEVRAMQLVIHRSMFKDCRAISAC